MEGDLDIEKYGVVAADARDKAWSLCQTQDGWTGVSTNVGEDVVLEWRDGDTGGVVREDGGQGGDAGWKCWRLSAVMEAEMDTVIEVSM